AGCSACAGGMSRHVLVQVVAWWDAAAAGSPRPRRRPMRRVPFVVLAAAAASVLAAAPALADPQGPTVLHLGLIDQQAVAPQPGSEPDTLVEPDIEVSPTNPDWPVAAAHDGRYPDAGPVDISYPWT